MPICAIGPHQAHAPVGPNPSWLRLVELEGDRAVGASADKQLAKGRHSETSPGINFDRWDTDAEGDWLP